MTKREVIQQYLDSRYGGGTLSRAYNRGRRVWCLLTTKHGLRHKYTLSSGACVRAWWYTLAEVYAEAITDAHARGAIVYAGVPVGGA